MESRARSLTKTITFRAIAVAGTFLITWIIQGNVGEATGVTILVHLYLTAIYYGNERVWDRLGWGRRTPESAHLQARIEFAVSEDE